MRRLQKQILAAGMFVFVCTGLCPPWSASLSDSDYRINLVRFVGFAPLIHPPKDPLLKSVEQLVPLPQASATTRHSHTGGLRIYSDADLRAMGYDIESKPAVNHTAIRIAARTVVYVDKTILVIEWLVTGVLTSGLCAVTRVSPVLNKN